MSQPLDAMNAINGSGPVSGQSPVGQNSENPESLGTVLENLEGVVADVSTSAALRDAVEKAFSYRGDVTLRTRNGRTLIGYLFDRMATSDDLTKCVARLLMEKGDQGESQRVVVSYADIVGLEFTGKDTAAGKSFQTWLNKYQEKKAAGEKNIGIEPEPL